MGIHVLHKHVNTLMVYLAAFKGLVVSLSNWKCLVCMYSILIRMCEIWLWRYVLLVQESATWNSVRVKDMSSNQLLLCVMLQKAYVPALKFALKCLHLTDERNGIDGKDLGVLSSVLVLWYESTALYVWWNIFCLICRYYSVKKLCSCRCFLGISRRQVEWTK